MLAVRLVKIPSSKTNCRSCAENRLKNFVGSFFFRERRYLLILVLLLDWDYSVMKNYWILICDLNTHEDEEVAFIRHKVDETL